MKKTTIIIICVVYLLSILAVQFFGVPVTVPEAGEYITSIEITDVTLSNRSDGQDTQIERVTDSTGKLLGFRFHFIDANEGEEYTSEEDNLALNPNRVKVTYKVLPEGVSQGAIKIITNGKVVVLPKTEEFAYEIVFLKKSTSTVEIREDKASVGVGTNVKIKAE